MNNKENEKVLIDTVKTLHNLIRDVVNKYELLKEEDKLPDELKGKEANFKSLLSLIGKIRRHLVSKDSDITKTIGFFGGQKRGKSSLINCLLGCDLMPVGPVPKSSVVIKTKQDNNCKKDKFIIDIHRSFRPLQTQEPEGVEQASKVLEQYASHSGSQSENVDEVIVKSLFPDSKILKNGGVLVDTPGAEYVFPDDDKDITKLEKSNKQDLNKALNILEDTEIILFVERADYLEGIKNYNFYEDRIQYLNPLNIVNFKDKFISEAKNKNDKTKDDLIAKFVSTFGARFERTICASSKEAKNNKDKSNIQEIEDMIIDELNSLKPEVGIERCLNELRKYLKQFKCKEIMPDGLKLHTLKRLLGQNNFDTKKSCGIIENIDNLKFKD